jgi:hypothetical protein
VCRVVAVVAAASKQKRYWAERPAAHTSASATTTTTTLFVTDPSLPPLASGSSSSTHSYLYASSLTIHVDVYVLASPFSRDRSIRVRLELPRWLPDGAVWDLPLVRDSLLYISNLLLRVEVRHQFLPRLCVTVLTRAAMVRGLLQGRVREWSGAGCRRLHVYKEGVSPTGGADDVVG